MLENFQISLLRRLMLIFYNFINGIRALVRYRAFATLQIELYCIVDCDSKWSTKFHKDCMLEKKLISLITRLMIILLIF